ncbi:hypothetical protein HUW51_10265 [Adhaeribacter swui]|uniref:Uncharacterized protein n=1 Tax=Adhaeribacter swui TaxID=2086471 RepID=A0A7G7G7F9_9BACT|nr:hypothetical protein [Adhaeribacter swui]QNF33093.1 hypothetical protein HUW51_10265 [Adhaeribacter swui]
MKKILVAITLAVVFTCCGKGQESGSADSNSTTEENSTTPPTTADSSNPVGVMMSDTSTAIADSLNSQK